MPFELTAKIEIAREGKGPPTRIWLNEGHDRPVWGSHVDQKAFATGKRLIPSKTGDLMLDGLVLAVLLKFPAGSAVTDLKLFDPNPPFIDLTRVDFEFEQLNELYQAVAEDLWGDEIRLVLRPGSPLLQRLSSWSHLDLNAKIAQSQSLSGDVEYVELWPIGSARRIETITERREGAADKIQRDLDAISVEDCVELELSDLAGEEEET